jgi:hypothetical protein
MNVLEKATLFFSGTERCIDVPKSIYLSTSTYNIWPDNEIAER